MTATTKRKLSELIREGAKLRPQTMGNFFDDDIVDGQTVLCSCVLGAAYEAATGQTDNLSGDIDDYLREMATYCNMPRWSIVRSAMHMNDYDHVTREQIADWLESEGY